MAKTISVAELIAQAKKSGIEVTGVPEPRTLSVRLSVKGAVSVYGLGRWPVTLYKGQWEALFGFLGVDVAKVNPAFRAVLAKGREKGEELAEAI